MAKLLAGFAAYYTAARKSHTILVDDAGCRRGTTVDRGEGISYAHRGNRGARNLSERSRARWDPSGLRMTAP